MHSKTNIHIPRAYASIHSIDPMPVLENREWVEYWRKTAWDILEGDKKPPFKRMLEVSPYIHEGYKQDNVFNSKYPDNDLMDFSSFPLVYGETDIILCCEVLEHVDNPFIAAETLALLAKEREAVIFLTTPFALREHGPHPDNWRFTTTGLKTLFSPYFKHIMFRSLEGKKPLEPINHLMVATNSEEWKEKLF